MWIYALILALTMLQCNKIGEARVAYGAAVQCTKIFGDWKFLKSLYFQLTHVVSPYVNVNRCCNCEENVHISPIPGLGTQTGTTTHSFF